MADVVLPGVTVSTLEPSAVISEVTCPWAPSPSPTVRMTAAMPMRMPRTVSAERRRWLSTPRHRCEGSRSSSTHALHVAGVVL